MFSVFQLGTLGILIFIQMLLLGRILLLKIYGKIAVGNSAIPPLGMLWYYSAAPRNVTLLAASLQYYGRLVGRLI